MSDFHVGQMVVCICDNWAFDRDPFSRAEWFHLTPNRPEKGRICTIRFIRDNAIALEEILNPNVPPGHVLFTPIEPAFSVIHFRPVKLTSIEVFRKAIAPIRERVS